MREALAAGCTVLTPNTELAAAVFDAVERDHVEAGRDIWPTPRIRDFGSWLRERYTAQVPDADTPRLLGEVEERELWRAVIDDTEPKREFPDAGAAARAAQRARRVVHDYGIPLRVLGAEPAEEVQAFLAWNRAFEERCAALNCISGEHLLGIVPAPDSPIRWVESEQWRPRTRQWLGRHGEALVAQDAATPRTAVPQPRNALRKPRTLQAVSPAAELAALAQWAVERLREDAGFRAWVCVPDLNLRRADVVDALDAAMAPWRFDLKPEPGGAAYAVAGGTPLADYAPVRSALETLAVCEGSLPFVRFSALLRSPDLQTEAADAFGAARLDVALRRRAPHEADLKTWLDLAAAVSRHEALTPPAALERLRTMRQTLAQLRGAQRVSAWVCVWLEALEAGPWGRRSEWSSVEYQAAERFRGLLATLATGDAVFGVQSGEGAQRILRRAARDTAFQPQTGVPAIWVSGQLMDPWLCYDGLWVTGLSDDRWPAPPDPLPLLPIGVQREYGVVRASAESQLTQALQLQSRWQARAAQCVFSCANPADAPRTLSPLLPKQAAPDAAWEPSAPQPHWLALCAAAPALEQLVDEAGPAFSAEESTHGVATLKAQSRCAFRGFAETRLAVRKLEQPVPGFDERERGELVHHALEHIWSALPDSEALARLSVIAQAQLLDEAAARAVAKVCKTRDPGPRWRERERDRLPRLLASWLDVERQRPPFTVQALEEKNQVARFAGLDFRVRIDRVDSLDDGARVLIDYKTGTAQRDWRGERPDNPQLPIYALLLPARLIGVAYAKVNAADLSFVAEVERRDVFRNSNKSSLEGEPSFAALIEKWGVRIERIAGEFKAGRAEVAPTPKACKTCDLHGLCRIPSGLEDDDDAYGA